MVYKVYYFCFRVNVIHTLNVRRSTTLLERSRVSYEIIYLVLQMREGNFVNVGGIDVAAVKIELLVSNDIIHKYCGNGKGAVNHQCRSTEKKPETLFTVCSVTFYGMLG